MPKVKTESPEGDGWERVAIRLHDEIQQRGLTRARIARDTGVSPQTLHKLLAGEPIARTDRLSVLASYLGWPGDGFERVRRGEDPHGPVELAASGVDLEELREADPEAYEQIIGMARIALDRARRRSTG